MTAWLFPVDDTWVIPPGDAPEFLAQMDLDPAFFRRAVEEGELAARNTDVFQPVTAAGLLRWITTVGSLRYAGVQTNRWSLEDPENRPVLRHVDGRWTLSLVGGSPETGLAEGVPLAARRKGTATAGAFSNQLTLSFPHSVPGPPAPTDRAHPPEGNWIFLYHRHQGGIRSEISLPLGFHEGQFTGWRARILLEPWEPGEAARELPGDVGGNDVEFRVEEA